jgi:hypothetical protein
MAKLNSWQTNPYKASLCKTMQEGNLFHPGSGWDNRPTRTLTGLGAGFEV